VVAARLASLQGIVDQLKDAQQQLQGQLQAAVASESTAKSAAASARAEAQEAAREAEELAVRCQALEVGGGEPEGYYGDSVPTHASSSQTLNLKPHPVPATHTYKQPLSPPPGVDPPPTHRPSWRVVSTTPPPQRCCTLCPTRQLRWRGCGRRQSWTGWRQRMRSLGQHSHEQGQQQVMRMRGGVGADACRLAHTAAQVHSFKMAA
jgi:hypothetical protein